MCKSNIGLLSSVLVLSLASVGWSGVSKPIPADGAVNEATWVSLGWTAGPAAASFDVYFGDSLDEVTDGTGEAFRGNQTGLTFIVGFVTYPFPDGLVTGATYYWRVDEIQTDGSVQTGPVWSFSVPARTATDPDPADGAGLVDPDTVTLGWLPGFGAQLHYVYFGDDYDAVNDATGGAAQGAATFDPGTLEREKVYYWRVDEFAVPDTFKGDVWSFTTAGAAGNPEPANGAVDVLTPTVLTWTPAETAASHDVYFGPDRDAVMNATAASPEFKGNKAPGAELLDVGELVWDTAYYWRVDAVYAADPANPVKGLVWSFTTANFLLVDGFESYNDIDPPEAGSKRIFDIWIDGFGTTTNGAIVGNELPPYAEQTVVRTGAQSMNLFYNNDNMTSEATLTLVSPRDWTVNDVNTLTLYFHGQQGNAPERMFVALNGNAVVYHDDPSLSGAPLWMAWSIDLQLFADQGVNLANVNTLTIGFGEKDNPVAGGGSGMMFFDDIRLATEATPAGRVLLLAENFEGLELGPNVDEGAGTEVWTDTPPVGWVIDESGIPGIGDPATDGVTEWAGWAFTDKDWWVGVADDQNRSQFALGQGTVAVADPDEWDDAGHDDAAAAGWYKTFMSTPSLDLSGVQAGSVQLEFDSSWRPEFDDNYHQSANVTVAFDGGDPLEVLLWVSDAGSPNFKPDATNETVVLELDTPPWATSMVVTFGLFDAGNDWWWAIDNLKISGIAE